MSAPRYFSYVLAGLALGLATYITSIGLGVVLLAVTAWLSRKERIPGHQHFAWRSAYLFTAVASAAAPVLVYIYFFTAIFYPAIPTSLGGGQPSYQSFVVAKETSCALRQLGIPFVENLNVTNLLPVLHDSDVLVSVWLRGPESKSGEEKSGEDWFTNYSVLQIDKKLVLASRTGQGRTVPRLTPLKPPC